MKLVYENINNILKPKSEENIKNDIKKDDVINFYLYLSNSLMNLWKILGIKFNKEMNFKQFVEIQNILPKFFHSFGAYYRNFDDNDVILIPKYSILDSGGISLIGDVIYKKDSDKNIVLIKVWVKEMPKEIYNYL